jgi:hypothetical protein
MTDKSRLAEYLAEVFSFLTCAVANAASGDKWPISSEWISVLLNGKIIKVILEAMREHDAERNAELVSRIFDQYCTSGLSAGGFR